MIRVTASARDEFFAVTYAGIYVVSITHVSGVRGEIMRGTSASQDFLGASPGTSNSITIYLPSGETLDVRGDNGETVCDIALVRLGDELFEV